MIKTIMGLSLWQPWASLIAIGAKKIETRSWPTNYRGLVAIHAAKRFQEPERMLVGEHRFMDALKPHYKRAPLPEVHRTIVSPLDLPLGCFIALGRLRHCLSTTEHALMIPDQATTDEF